ncbi:EAL domain-containing protein [Anoxybacteroides amylolyticum]|uniref:EAL domain protein n=1 Tax=Anoxybacteroides amylolyticum TaxID=294699 RepID=A0A160F563_9BACL|nr:EAL domain-containing protein [Anoxybacillus amylolyticus]ANB61132.1 EAL domain protein [Anoxybacillus amylolyticus]
MESNMTIRDIIVNQLFENVFQPIYRLIDWDIIGYESLFRCPFVSNPEEFFLYVNEHGSIYNLDIASIVNSLKQFSIYNKSVSYNVCLFLNVYPSTIAMPFFPQVMNQLVKNVSLLHQQVILEINESEKVENLDKVLSNIYLLKEQGFLIAVDDLGKRDCSLQLFIEIGPSVIKVDRSFAKNLSKDTKKQRYLSSVVQLFGKDTKIVLEGIETEEDFQCAKWLGVSYGQGYYLGKPSKLSVKTAL